MPGWRSCALLGRRSNEPFWFPPSHWAQEGLLPFSWPTAPSPCCTACHTSFILFYLMHIGVLPACISVLLEWQWYTQRPEEVVRAPGTRVTGYEPPCESSDSNQQPAEEQPVLGAAEPPALSLAPAHISAFLYTQHDFQHSAWHVYVPAWPHSDLCAT